MSEAAETCCAMGLRPISLNTPADRNCISDMVGCKYSNLFKYLIVLAVCVFYISDKKYFEQMRRFSRATRGFSGLLVLPWRAIFRGARRTAQLGAQGCG